MKRFVSGVVAAVLAASCVPNLAFAHPVVIRELSVGQLLGMSSSTAVLQSKVSAHEDRIVIAAGELGMYPDETAELLRKVRQHDLQWVEIPRHLDGMAWIRHDQVRVTPDVIIPAQIYGWEIDIPSQHGELFAFLPQVCGNLAVIREKVMASSTILVSPQPDTPMHFSFQNDYPPVSPAPPLPYTPDLPSIQTPETSHSRFPWFLLLPIGLAFFHGGNTPSTPGIPTIPIIPGQPTPPPGPPPPPTSLQCWEEPSATCDVTTQSRIRHN